MAINTIKNAVSAQGLFKSVGQGALHISKLFTVDGWVAVVTGGGTGLGLVTANALADNGVKVYITGRRLEPLAQAARQASCAAGTGAIIPIQADVSTKEGILKLRERLEAEERFINILINNHGISIGCADINAVEQTPEALSAQMFDNESFDAWLETYKINTASYHFTSFALLPLLAAAKSVGGFAEPGNIINLSSMSGITKTSQRGQFNYNASKAATISLSHQLATEFARRNLGIRVNVVCPGYFPSVGFGFDTTCWTPANAKGMTVINPDENTGSKEHYAEFRQKWGIPFGRPGSAIDYAQCILGLVKASRCFVSSSGEN